MAESAVLAASPVPPAAPPLWARRLGYAGLAPFVVGALLVHVVHPEAHPYATLALAAYGAAILSFLGGIHWGVAMRAGAVDAGVFTWAVVPSLVAWVATVMPPSAGLVVLGAMLVVCYAVDRRRYPVYGLQHWLTLRFRLSAVASLSCFLGAAGT